MSEHAQQVQRKWMPYAKAAREYVGVDKSLLLGGIKRHELPAFKKPLTKGRSEGAATEHHSYFVCLDDVDAWIRTHWEAYA